MNPEAANASATPDAPEKTLPEFYSSCTPSALQPNCNKVAKHKGVNRKTGFIRCEQVEPDVDCWRTGVCRRQYLLWVVGAVLCVDLKVFALKGDRNTGNDEFTAALRLWVT